MIYFTAYKTGRTPHAGSSYEVDMGELPHTQAAGLQSGQHQDFQLPTGASSANAVEILTQLRNTPVVQQSGAVQGASVSTPSAQLVQTNVV